MGREKDYENTLVEIVNHLKGLHTILSSVMLDTAAVRQTILTGRTRQLAYAERVRAGAKISKPLLESAMRSYDQIIAKLQNAPETGNEKAPKPQIAETPLLH